MEEETPREPTNSATVLGQRRSIHAESPDAAARSNQSRPIKQEEGSSKKKHRWGEEISKKKNKSKFLLFYIL
jgi:hypothetical protein